MRGRERERERKSANIAEHPHTATKNKQTNEEAIGSRRCGAQIVQHACGNQKERKTGAHSFKSQLKMKCLYLCQIGLQTCNVGEIVFSCALRNNWDIFCSIAQTHTRYPIAFNPNHHIMAAFAFLLFKFNLCVFFVSNCARPCTCCVLMLFFLYIYFNAVLFKYFESFFFSVASACCC